VRSIGESRLRRAAVPKRFFHELRIDHHDDIEEPSIRFISIKWEGGFVLQCVVD
jgi:hypothetical protein